LSPNIVKVAVDPGTTLFFLQYHMTNLEILVKIDLAVVPFNHLTCTVGTRGGLMVSALDSRSSGSDSSPGQGNGVVLLGKTLYSHRPADLMLGVTLRWTSIPSRGK